MTLMKSRELCKKLGLCVEFQICGFLGSNFRFAVFWGQISNFMLRKKIKYKNDAFGVHFAKDLI